VKRVAGWRRSGLTAKEYAGSIGVNAGSLMNWASRLQCRKRRRPAKRGLRVAMAAAPSMIEVVAGAGSGVGDARFELHIEGGRRLQIPPSFDAAALRRLLEVLEERR
jgi:hypothetical protein